MLSPFFMTLTRLHAFGRTSCSVVKTFGNELTIVAAWLEHARALIVPRSLYLSAIYGKSFLELRLLNLTQAVEAYHRRFYSGRYMKEEDYEAQVSSLLQEAIPTGLDSSLRDSLKSRLKYGNEYSFHKRLRSLFSEHEVALATIVPNPSRWISKIRDYRNNFTHHPVIGDTPHSIDAEEVIRCNHVLRILLELCFLKSMGMTAEEIVGLSAKCSNYRQIRERFFLPEK